MREIKFVTDAVIKTARASETAIRKAWSLMEAAAEKKQPSQVMSRETIRHIQGKKPGG
jgi:hypothetical protein